MDTNERVIRKLLFKIVERIPAMNELISKYDEVVKILGIVDNKTLQDKINIIVKESLKKFADSCRVPSIWCFGQHTKMLMADFMYEMKAVKYIIDNNYKGESQSGFRIITQDEINNYHIDGIIISSFKHKESIKNITRSNFPKIEILDIYDELAREGIILNYDYFSQTHPFCRYAQINQLQRGILDEVNVEKKKKLYIDLIKAYVSIKDFRLALKYTQKLEEIDTNFFVSDLRSKLGELYHEELCAVEEISENDILMMCIDGLRRRDFIGEKLPKLRQWVSDNALLLSNAYSMSTSTYESLLPAFSENDDLRTQYYNKSSIDENNCRFIMEAIKQNRNIQFYTDVTPYIDSKHINVSKHLLTASEKIWEFINDAREEANGLFYIHILYESHFSYSNPYTANKLIADGTNILFDFLAINGGKMRTDYEKQQTDALAYIDDLLYPFLKRIKCRTIIFADHGNLLLPSNARLSDIKRTQLSFSDELVEIPIIIKSPEYECGESNQIQTLKCLNDLLISLLNETKIELHNRQYIKILRSHIYNPDFIFLYKKCNYEQELLAFELFVFNDGTKLALYENGNYEIMFNVEEASYYIEIIRNQITVCDNFKL